MKPKQTPKEKAIAFAEEGRRIAAAIEDAVLALHPDDSDVLTVYAERVRHCNRDANIWHAVNLNKPGEAELFDGSGRFWRCGSKLCAYCLAKMSQANRANLRRAIAKQRVMPAADREAIGKWIARPDRSDENFPQLSPQGLLVGEKYSFITLTLPTKYISLLTAHEIIDYAWSLFRKRRWFKRHILGGGKAEEFTVHKIGFHYHIHVLARTRYVHWHDLRDTWTECVKKAFLDADRDWKVNTKDGMINAHEKTVGSINDAIKEVAKYMTKSCSWAQMDQHQLLDACRIRRWPRMFELFGEFATAKLLPVAAHEAEELLQKKEDRENKDYLDTTPLSDARPESGWRDELQQLGVVRYLEKMETDALDQASYRKEQLRNHYKYATFKRLPDKSTVNIERTIKRLLETYARSGLPPPHSVTRHMPLSRKIAIGARLDNQNYTWYQPTI